MRTLTLLTCLLLLGGCITVVDNDVTFEEDWLDTNPGNTDEMTPLPEGSVEAVMKSLPPEEEMAAMSPEERATTIEKAVTGAIERGDVQIPSSQAGPSEASGQLSGQQTGRGWAIVNIFQSGEATSDIQAQVEAALRAAAAVNSPNSTADTSGNEQPKPDDDKPKDDG